MWIRIENIDGVHHQILINTDNITSIFMDDENFKLVIICPHDEILNYTFENLETCEKYFNILSSQLVGWIID